jgi:hypothetical protein
MFNFYSNTRKDLLVLSDSAKRSQLIVSPAYQGRVMTSTAEGDSGMSFGWLNHDLISSAQKSEHINAFGGEDRLLAWSRRRSVRTLLSKKEKHSRLKTGM